MKIEAYLKGLRQAKKTEFTALPHCPVLCDEALHGLAGSIAQKIHGQSESHIVAILLQLLVVIGNYIGRNAHFRVGATKHSLTLFVVLVGMTARARKGTGLGLVMRVMELIDKEWVTVNRQSGLSSGEGLIHAVRDSRTWLSSSGRKLRDPGVDDKRLLVIEPEFSLVLKVAGREGNTLSPVLRQAWDGEDLQVLSKNHPERATAPHISLIGHTTEEDLRRYLSATEQANGYGNRILWPYVHRSKALPRGGLFSLPAILDEVQDLEAALQFAQKVGQMRRDSQAEDLWEEVYPILSEDRYGLYGAITARAEAQVMRISCLYALLDQSLEIRSEHLLAALALWKYCDDSARLIFGRALGDPIADKIEHALLGSPGGLTRTDINHFLKGNRPRFVIEQALDVLKRAGRARVEHVDNGHGRPAEVWFPSEPDKC